MKYYSDVTKKMYETISDLEAAEKEASEKTNARKEDAAKVEAAFNEMVAARRSMKKLCASSVRSTEHTIAQSSRKVIPSLLIGATLFLICCNKNSPQSFFSLRGKLYFSIYIYCITLTSFASSIYLLCK